MLKFEIGKDEILNTVRGKIITKLLFKYVTFDAEN